MNRERDDIQEGTSTSDADKQHFEFEIEIKLSTSSKIDVGSHSVSHAFISESSMLASIVASMLKKRL